MTFRPYANEDVLPLLLQEGIRVAISRHREREVEVQALAFLRREGLEMLMRICRHQERGPEARLVRLQGQLW